MGATMPIEIEDDVLRAIVQILEIASDWNAPPYYDIVPPKGWEDTRDPGSYEPTWVSLSLFTSRLRALNTSPKTGNNIGEKRT